MQCFAVKGTTCVTCGIKGEVIHLDRWHDGSLHVDLYGKTIDNKLMLMTIDHIKPKSKGGKNNISNYQPMCQLCNTTKGAKYDSKE
jgi:5-methylcytosine-specific restriction endonuclease McrA